MLETIPHSLYRRISHINIKRAPRKHARARRSRKGSAIRKRPASYAPPASPSLTSARGSPEVEPRRAAGVTASPIVADYPSPLSDSRISAGSNLAHVAPHRSIPRLPPPPPRGTPRATPGEHLFFPRKVHGKRFFAQLWVATAF